jgi:heme A synthase
MRAGHQIEYVLPHLAWGVLTAVVAGRAALVAWSVGDRIRGVTWPGLILGGGVLLQIMVGLATFYVNTISFEELDRPMSQFATATVHQTLGAVVLASAVVLYLRARRNMGLALEASA